MSQSVAVNNNVTTSEDLLGASLNSEAIATSRPLAMGDGEVTVNGKAHHFKFELGAVKDGVANLVVDVQDKATHALASIGTAIQILAGKPARTVATIAAVAAMTPAHAILIPDGAVDIDYLNHANLFQGSTLWLQAKEADGTIGYASAVRINDWYGLTAAHNVDINGDFRTLTEVGNGSNFSTDPGDIRSISSVLVNPNYTDAFSGNFDDVDLAIIKFDRPLAGPNITIGDMAIGDNLSGGGFGVFGTPTNGYNSSQDGYRRAFDAPVARFGSTHYSTDYAGLRFSPTIPYLNGKVSPGDSGSPEFNSNGQLVALNVGENGGISPIGTTISYRLMLQKDWIDINTQAVPEPGSLIVFAFGGIGLAVKRHFSKK